MHKVRSGKTEMNAAPVCVDCSLDNQVHLAYIALAQKGNLRTYRPFDADLILASGSQSLRLGEMHDTACPPSASFSFEAGGNTGCMNPDCIFIPWSRPSFQ